MIRVVLFDLDGVVRHFDPLHVADIERRHGLIPGSIEAFAFSKPLIDLVTTGRIRRSEWIAAIADHLGNTGAADEWDRQPFRTDPDLLTLADELHASGSKTAILTNGTDTIPREAEDLGLADRFDRIFNSASICYAKPDPRAFVHVLDALEVAGPEVFFVDGSPAKLAGAAKLGMITHHFKGIQGLREALREHGIGRVESGDHAPRSYGLARPRRT